MDIRDEIQAAERAIQDAGLSRVEFFRRAKIHHKSWHNWRRGNLPSMQTWLRVQAALKALR